MSQNAHEHYPLQVLQVNGPDYSRYEKVLRNSYIEEDVKFAGIINDLSTRLDPTNRTEVLSVIDQEKRSKVMPWKLDARHEAKLYISVHNVKICRKDGEQEVLLRIPIHEIESVCYIQDDNDNVLVLKYGSMDDPANFCHLAVVYCPSRDSGICLAELTNQCFIAVYTEATMQFLESQVHEADRPLTRRLSMSSSTSRSVSEVSTASNKYDKDHRGPSFFSNSTLNLDQSVSSGGGGGVHTPRTQRRRDSPATSDTDSVMIPAEITHNYMAKLQKKLNPDELRRFASLLKAWHTNMTIVEFCESVLELYGPDRKYLLTGLRPFIHEKDQGEFNSFLQRIKVNEDLYNEDSASISSKKYSRRTPSSGSGSLSSTNHGDEFERVINNLSTDIEGLETSTYSTHHPHLSNPHHHTAHTHHPHPPPR